MAQNGSGYSRNGMIGIVGVLTFGLTSLVAVLGGGPLVAAIFVVGFFILIPLIALLGEEFPYVEASAEPASATRQDPVETLQERFARGEIDREEFERRLEYIVTTEDLTFDVEEELGALDPGRERDHREGEREFELE